MAAFISFASPASAKILCFLKTNQPIQMKYILPLQSQNTWLKSILAQTEAVAKKYKRTSHFPVYYDCTVSSKSLWAISTAHKKGTSRKWSLANLVEKWSSNKFVKLHLFWKFMSCENDSCFENLPFLTICWGLIGFEFEKLFDLGYSCCLALPTGQIPGGKRGI